MSTDNAALTGSTENGKNRYVHGSRRRGNLLFTLITSISLKRDCFFEGGCQNRSGRRGFKRVFERPSRENVKRTKLDVGSRLKESESGITEYIGKHPGFFAIIKERYNDFHVNEIDLDGQVAKLTQQDIPRDPCDDENIEDLKALISPAIWNQLQVLEEENPSNVEIDVTGIDKIERRTIHTIAKKLANVVSQTIDRGDRKFLTIVLNTESSKNGKNGKL